MRYIQCIHLYLYDLLVLNLSLCLGIPACVTKSHSFLMMNIIISLNFNEEPILDLHVHLSLITSIHVNMHIIVQPGKLHMCVRASYNVINVYTKR